MAPHHPHDDSYPGGINGRTGAATVMPPDPPRAHRPQTLQSEQKPRDQARILIKALHRTINTHPKETKSRYTKRSEQAVAAPINGGRKREETKESTKWEKNPKRVKGSRKNRIANRVKNKPDLENAGGKGRLYQQQWPPLLGTEGSRARAQLERRKRGEERPQWRIIVWAEMEKEIEKRYVSLYLEESRIIKSVGERRQPNGTSGRNYSFALLPF